MNIIDEFAVKEIEFEKVADENKNFLLNISILEKNRNRHVISRNYSDQGFYTILGHLTRLLSFKGRLQNPVPFVKPFELSKLSFKEVEKLSIIEKAMYNLLKNLNEFEELFKIEPEKFNSRKFSLEMTSKLKTEYFSQDFNFEFTNQIPKTNEALLNDLEKQLPKARHYIDVIGFEVARYICSDANIEYKFTFLQNLQYVFKDGVYNKENHYWLNCYPRKSDASFSGHLDMAFHAWLNDGDFVSEMILNIKNNQEQTESK